MLNFYILFRAQNDQPASCLLFDQFAPDTKYESEQLKMHLMINLF